MHLAAAVDNSTMIEWFDRELDIRKEDELYLTSVEPTDGFACPSNEPGFGIRIDEDNITRFALRK